MNLHMCNHRCKNEETQTHTQTHLKPYMRFALGLGLDYVSLGPVSYVIRGEQNLKKKWINNKLLSSIGVEVIKQVNFYVFNRRKRWKKDLLVK